MKPGPAQGKPNKLSGLGNQKKKKNSCVSVIVFNFIDRHNASTVVVAELASACGLHL